MRLPRATSYYFTRVDPDFFDRIAAHIRGDPLDLRDLGKKYLVYYDGPVADANVCGVSNTSATIGGALGYSLVFVRSCEADDLGSGGVLAAVAAHELIHNLGGEATAAPHDCSPAPSHHPCDSADDILFPASGDVGLAGKILDVGRDDYYGHSGSWWDVRDSPWLAHLDAPAVTLSVSVSGGGSVAGSLPGAACAAACTSSWDAGSRVRLTARARPGRRFAGWTGACRGTKACSLRLEAARGVGAAFSRR